ncbi:MAG: hypothetical protein U0359_39510 [Byssovorax sp.]
MTHRSSSRQDLRLAGGLDRNPPPAAPARARAARLLGCTLGAAIALYAFPARGEAPPIELDDGPRLVPLDLLDDPEGPRPFAHAGSAPLWLALDTRAGQDERGERAWSALLVLNLPLDRIAAVRPLRAAIAEGPGAPGPRDPGRAAPPPPPPELKPPARPARPEAPAPPAAPSKVAPPAGAERPPPLAIPIPVSAAAAATLVEAALRRAGLLDPGARADLLAARAHRSALLPELRLRVSRTVDEGQTLSPTEYDPTRRTATGGTSLWVEARATFRLDRLLFADDELGFERMREQRAEQQQRLRARVLERLFAWQRASALAADPSAAPEENLTARLHAAEAEVELDVLTGGAFSRWRASAIDTPDRSVSPDGSR